MTRTRSSIRLRIVRIGTVAGEVSALVAVIAPAGLVLLSAIVSALLWAASLEVVTTTSKAAALWSFSRTIVAIAIFTAPKSISAALTSMFVFATIAAFLLWAVALEVPGTAAREALLFAVALSASASAFAFLS